MFTPNEWCKQTLAILFSMIWVGIRSIPYNLILSLNSMTFIIYKLNSPYSMDNLNLNRMNFP